jgi:hypothetical protein
MRITCLATLVAVVATTLSTAPSATADAPAGPTAGPTADARAAQRAKPKPVLTLSASAPTYLTTDSPVLTYSFLHKRKGDRLQLQLKPPRSSVWRRAQSIWHTKKKHHGGGTVTLAPQALGAYRYRVVVISRLGSTVAASPELSVPVFGPVPIANLVKATSSSNAVVHSGTVSIGGAAFPYTFERYLTGASIWRSVIDLSSTSCNAIGIPLASRRRDASTGGTFSMRAVTTGDAVVTANAAAPDVPAGLLSAVPLGARLAVQVMSDRDVDYFGAGQAICYTSDGRA